MRIGVIGVGRIGALHARTLASNPQVPEVVVADADDARARAVAAELGAAAASIDELYGGRVDALVVAAPTATHAGLVHRALDARLPVFCEKPLAPDLDATLAVVEHAERSGTPVQVGFQRRYDPGHQALREAVEDGRLGRLHLVRAVTADPAPPPAAYIATSGGMFRDCHIHDFDSIRFVTGREFVSVYATG